MPSEITLSETALSYSHGTSAIPLLGETIGASLRRVAARYPDAEVLVDVPAGRRWTYAAFDADTDTLARGLIAAGLAAGDRVGICAPNCAEWVLLQYATAKAGLILVTINPAYRSHELSYALRQRRPARSGRRAGPGVSPPRRHRRTPALPARARAG